MEKIKAHYCWIKVVKATEAGDPEGVKGASLESTAAQGAKTAVTRKAQNPSVLSIEALRKEAVEQPASQALFSGGRPPPSIAALSSESQDVALRLLNGHRPPGVYAGSVLAGWWSLDRDFDGDRGSGTLVEMLSFIGTRDEAITWLGTADGITWRATALTYFLLCFTNTGDF